MIHGKQPWYVECLTAIRAERDCCIVRGTEGNKECR